MPTLEEFHHKFLPEAIADGSFGKDVQVLGVVTDGKEGKDQFASSVLFVSVKLRVDGQVKECPLVAKFQAEDEFLRKKFNTNLQFFNEVSVYKDILTPLFKKNTTEYFPKFYFGRSTLDKPPEDDVIMIGDLTPQGFRLSDERIFLDAEHCLITFRKLGEFHGASLAIKNQDEQSFKKAMDKLIETRWLESKRDYDNYFYGENAKRGVIPLLKDEKTSEIAARFVDRLSDVSRLVVSDIFSETELSVLCHGDFCRNNMLFRYESGRPVEVKFFDPATARYASPVVDMSFFLFLNTSAEVRRSHIKDFVQAYLQGMKETAGEFAPEEEVLWKEFQAKAVYGYLVAAFFIPVMFNDQPVKSDPTESLEDGVNRILKYGGEKVTKMLEDIVIDLITWGCLK